MSKSSTENWLTHSKARKRNKREDDGEGRDARSSLGQPFQPSYDAVQALDEAIKSMMGGNF